MTLKKTDRRITRTRRMIIEAFTLLMEEKGFEAITVSDLTEKADINRGTFYQHYKDKYDLLEQSEKEIFEGLNKIVVTFWHHANYDVEKVMKVDDLLPLSIQLFEFIGENYQFMRVLLGPKGSPSFQNKLKHVIIDTLLHRFSPFLKEDHVMVPPDYLLAYISSAHLGLIQHWLESGMDRSPEEVARILSQTAIFGPVKVSGIQI
ncbi:TetR/AcrR family transcriptional regulator [Paenibacillus albiflavus]|uniref:TetR/AcrR family transcriptional regulator n=1 Tax=Paenibacillus albiflavus TaxID=2545760 RepID=A0A4R4EEM8_9BACL|nr:TetR/AcrR family transcriptional regulator [Paenibacillus albiflavus]TCZ78476.1 TetR/AcrR family transcriptional regulator [Paenibacillus albiflavus]